MCWLLHSFTCLHCMSKVNGKSGKPQELCGNLGIFSGITGVDLNDIKWKVRAFQLKNVHQYITIWASAFQGFCKYFVASFLFLDITVYTNSENAPQFLSHEVTPVFCWLRTIMHRNDSVL